MKIILQKVEFGAVNEESNKHARHVHKQLKDTGGGTETPERV